MIPWDNPAHLHLLVNHLPLFGTVFGAALLALALVRKSADLTLAAYLLLVVGAIGVPLAVNTGHRAEERVEGLPGVSEALIEEHEAAADWVRWIGLPVGALALGGLLFRRLGNSTGWRAVTLVGALLSSAVIARTAATGGPIRHTEIRKAGVAATAGDTAGTSGEEPEREDEAHEDR